MLPHDARSPFEQNPWKRFSNGSSETIPPFSVMRVTGATNSGNQIVFTCNKPNTSEQSYYLVNGPFAVPAGKHGICTTLTQGGYVAYRSGSGTPANGESWGAANNQWTLEKNVPGFVIAGGTKTTGGVTSVAAVQVSAGSGPLSPVAGYTSTEMLMPNASNPTVILDTFESGFGGQGITLDTSTGIFSSTTAMWCQLSVVIEVMFDYTTTGADSDGVSIGAAIVQPTGSGTVVTSRFKNPFVWIPEGIGANYHTLTTSTGMIYIGPSAGFKLITDKSGGDVLKLKSCFVTVFPVVQ